MAIDQTNVALDMAVRTVDAAGRFLNGLSDLEEELEHGVQAGLNFTEYDTDFADSDALQHVDGATLNKVLATVVPAMRAYLEATSSGADTYEALLYKAKR